MTVHPALIGKAGEMLVAAELMRRGVEVAQPHSDIGVDLIAYRLNVGETVPTKLVAIQVKSASGVRFAFHKSWLKKAPNLVLVWNLTTTPEFFVFDTVASIEDALGAQFSASPSWSVDGRYSITNPGEHVLKRMEPHRGQWDRIKAQL